MRSFGVGKRSFESCIAEEAEFLIQEIIDLKDASFDPRSLFTNATSNLICSVVFRKRYGYSDSDFKYLLTLIDENVKIAGAGGVQFFFPIARYLQPGHFKQLKGNIDSILKFLRGIAKQHELSHDADNPNDYIDVYLNEIKASQGSDAAEHFNNKNMLQAIVTLFGAGSETTATTLRWAVKYMMAYPEIQKKVQQEIDSVVGRNRFPR